MSSRKKKEHAVSVICPETIGRLSPGRLLHDAQIRMSASLMHVLRGAGHELTAEGWALLSLLAESDELSQFELGERVGKDRHHTSRLIDGLEQQGLVIRKSTKDDRRVKLISVTDKGRDVRRKLIRVVLAHLDEVFEGVSPRDYDAFIRVLLHITQRLPARDHRGEAAPVAGSPLTGRGRRPSARSDATKP